MKKLGIMLLFMFFVSFSTVHAEQHSLEGVVNEDLVSVKDVQGTIVGSLIKGSKITYELVDEQRSKILFQGKELYIEANKIETIEEIKPTVVEKNIGSVKSRIPYSIYLEPSVDSVKIFEGAQEEMIQVRSIINGFYEIEFAGHLAYLPINQGIAIFDNISAFEVIGSDAPIYELSEGELVQKGTIASNTSWKIARETAGYHVLRIGSKEAFVPKLNTFSSLKNPSVQAPKSAKYSLSLVTEKVTPVFTKDGRALGSLNKGSLVYIKGIDGRRAIINFYGKDARVYFNHLVHTNVIQPKQSFSHLETAYYLQVFAAMYPEFTELKRIGKSVEGRDIYALKLGKGKKEILMDASVHAREHMSTNVLLEMLDTYSFQYLKNLTYEGFPSRSILNNVSIWFVPMMNPDGVTLVQSGANSVQNGALATKINNGSTNFQAWKANVRGVDLNDNFDSGWEKITSTVNEPSPSGYRGPRVFSEPESQALRNFVLSRDFKGYYSYHTSGQIIYWFQFQKGTQASRDLNLARKVSSLTGYQIVPPMYKLGSGASTDWFIETSKMPGLVIEISPYVGNKTVPLAYWDSIWKQNRKVGLFLAKDADSR